MYHALMCGLSLDSLTSVASSASPMIISRLTVRPKCEHKYRDVQAILENIIKE